MINCPMVEQYTILRGLGIDQMSPYTLQILKPQRSGTLAG